MSAIFAFAGLASVAFVVPQLWEWFVVPLGVPPVDGWQALGLMSLFAAARIDVDQLHDRGSRSKEDEIATGVVVVLKWWIALALGWAYQGLGGGW